MSLSAARFTCAHFTRALRSTQRRTLLKAFTASGLLALVERNTLLAQTAPDFKALVCLYQAGGNDGENTLVAYDTAGYVRYAGVRTPASGINIARADLLPIQPTSLTSPYGFHPACVEMRALFDQQQLAVIANVGMLALPAAMSGTKRIPERYPANLFSHSDQALAMQSAVYTGLNRTGWGGRLADKLAPINSGTAFPALTTTAGMKIFATGNTSIPVSVGNDPVLALAGSGKDQNGYDAVRDATLRKILLQSRINTYDIAAQLLAEEGLAAAAVVSPILQSSASVVGPLFAHLTSDIARQLRTVALMLEGRAQTGLKRQIFFTQHLGYDTHGGQAGEQARLLRELSQALLAFQNAVAALGLNTNVTTFTMSDFGRTFKPAASGGTDHGWGNYAFVLGGAVKGGDFYGQRPVLALSGPDDFDDSGRWIPSTSIEEYGATLCRWFGVSDADLPYVFPNSEAFLGSFANNHLKFMKT